MYEQYKCRGIDHIPLITQYYDHISSSSNHTCYFMTINWKPGVTPDKTERIIQNIKSKKWFPQETIYTYEQRGTCEAEIGVGYHNHFLMINLDKPQSQIHREIYSTIKNFVGNKMHLDIRKIPPEWVPDKIKYLKGEKWDPEKADKTAMDECFRKQYALDTLYGSISRAWWDATTRSDDDARAPPARNAADPLVAAV